MKPTIIIVGADKGGVGKTTITRALLDYLTARGVEHRAFDTETPAGDLKRFAVDAEVIDIGTISGQMAVFDAAEEAGVTVVDLRAGMLSPTLQALDDAKLLDEVRSGGMNLALLHVLGPTVASIGEIATAANRVGGGAHHFLVKNYINATQFFDWDKDEAQGVWTRMADMTVVVPQLPEIACEIVQKRGGSFVDFTTSAQSRILRGRVRTWLDTVWAEFDRVKLPELFPESFRSALA